jgi:aspartate aminotransferase
MPTGLISLAIGDPDMPTPGHIVEALEVAIRSGYTHYADRPGDPELRSALAEHLSARFGRHVVFDEVLVTQGSSAGLASTMLASLNPGDRVLIPEPTYSLYADIARFAGAEPVFVGQTSNFHLDLDQIEAHASDCKMVVICTPCNPTGAVYTRDELLNLGAICAKFGMLVLSDEAYDQIVFDGTEFASAMEIPALQEHLVYCQTFSKTYAMTGWRLGYVHADARIVAAANTVHQTFNGSLNAAVQRAALAALTGPMDWLSTIRRTYQRRRDLVVSALRDAPGLNLHPPEGTFYAFVGNDKGLSASEMAHRVQDHGVLVRPGTEFGPSGEGFVRISFSVADEILVQGLERLRNALELGPT